MTLRLASSVYNPAELPPEHLAATFVGRGHLLDELVRTVASQSASDSIQHYLLLGPRGIGKTTLLLMLYRRVKSEPALAAQWLAVRFREEEYYAYSLRDLLALALESLHREEGVAEAEAILDEVEAEGDDERSLARALDGLRRISKACGKRILLLIDNFDLVFLGSRSAEEDQRALRKRLITESFLMVIGTSTRQFEEIYSYDDAFFNFFSPIGVENLDDEQVEELLLTRARLEGCQDFLEHYDENRGKVRAITYLTGGNPRLVVMLYEILSRHQILPVVQALRETIDKLTPLLKDVLEDMPRQQSKILDALMRLDGVASPSQVAELSRLPLNAVTTQLGRLKEARLVESEGEGRGRPATYRVRDQMLRTWYQMRYLRPARRRVEVFVEFLRAWFSLAERLALLDGFRRDLAASMSSGLRQRAGEIALSMDYFAASIEEPPERARQVREVAWAYLQAGQTREVALSLADLHPERATSDARRETIGYSALTERMLERGDAGRAIETLTELLARDPANLQAKLDLGLAYGQSGEHERARAAFTDVAEAPGTDADLRSRALANRALARGALGDSEGAVADYTAAVELDGAPVEQVARALFNRGGTKVGLGDSAGALADYTAVIELDGAPVEQVAWALANRGAAYLGRGDHTRALADYEEALNLPGVSQERSLEIRSQRARTLEHLGRVDEAVADYRRCVEGGTSARAVQTALTALVRILSQAGRIDEAKSWVARMGDLEPVDTPAERRLEARIDLIVTISRSSSPDLAEAFLDTALETSPSGVRERLRFLKPGLALARSGDESVLAKLPQEEQRIARDIAARLRQDQPQAE